MTVFWYTLCDLQSIFAAAGRIQGSLDSFFGEVSQTMNDFGNFGVVYYRHGHFARTLRSSEYRNKLTSFATAFTNHKQSLQALLTQSSALQINDISANLTGVGAKLNQVDEKLDKLGALGDKLDKVGAVGDKLDRLEEVSRRLEKAMEVVGRQTDLERVVEKKVGEKGEGALKDPGFLNELARSHFGAKEGEEVGGDVKEALGQGLEDALKANMPQFAIKVEAAQKEMSEALEKSTETILQQLNSGPYQLIKDEDIKTVWQTMNWRISCKSRHFVDAVHNHFTQKFNEHRHKEGEVHRDEWTLNVLSQVIYYPNISDAIDDDGSGYISVHEVNQFFKSRPPAWSAVQWLSFWAAGWKQNALAYKTRCKALFSSLEAAARTVRPQNRPAVKSYINTSGLSELWLVVNSLTPDSLGHRTPEAGPLNALKAEFMSAETTQIRSHLEKIQYRLESPEMVMAALGTHRLEGFILCFLELILERHCQIMEAANTLVLGEREFQAMTLSLKNLVLAVSTRYHTLTQSWKQQRLDTGFLVQCFAGGIFNDWHEVFQDQPSPHTEASETPKASGSLTPDSRGREKPPSRPEDILMYPLPPQPSPTSAEDAGHGSPPRRLAPLPHPQGPRRSTHQRHNPHNASSSSTADYFYRFDFEGGRASSERPGHGPGHGHGHGTDPASISDVYRKTKKPKLEDRITSLETELSDIKGMLSQLILLSSPRQNGT
ncbi:hypothetical protein C8R44DRAFT_356116 [Mycena epipterygia]|nr:hypothetical protein C8R44DRAFT_356116 [Mycena epipterygia]